MMKPFTFIAMILMCCKTLAQVPPELTWTKEYSGTSYATNSQFFPVEAQSCAFDTSGRLIVAGRIYDYRPSTGLWYEYLKLIKYTTAGKVMADVNISGAASGIKSQKVNKIINDQNTNTVYTLSTYYYSNTNKTDIHLARYTTGLILMWEKFISGSDSSIDVGVDMELDNSGNVILAGNMQNDGTGATTGQDIEVYKYSKTGSLLWAYSYTGTGKNTDKINAIKIDHNQNVIGVGNTYNAAKGYQLLVFKLAKSSGSLQWQYKYNGDSTSNAYDEANDVDVDNSNNIYVAASIQLTGAVTKGLLLKLNAAGTSVFKKQETYLPNPQSVIFKNNAVYMAGDNLTGGFQKIKLSKFTLTGTQTFANSYSAFGGSNNYFNNMSVSNSNTIYIVGKTNNSYYFLSVENLGITLWQHYDTPASPSDTHGGTCVAIDERYGVAAGCGFKHHKNGEGEWTSNYYTPALLRTQQYNANTNEGSILNVYPNPASDFLAVNCTAKNSVVEIADLTGRIVLYETFSTGTKNLNIEMLSAGVYTVTVTAGDKKYFKKFIKQ
ncbi:MAG: T9SS type A sorting domain-containing protein [Bacteroidia bacterium]